MDSHLRGNDGLGWPWNLLVYCSHPALLCQWVERNLAQGLLQRLDLTGRFGALRPFPSCH